MQIPNINNNEKLLDIRNKSLNPVIDKVNQLATEAASVKTVNGKKPDDAGNILLTQELPTNAMMAVQNSDLNLNTFPTEAGLVRLGGSNPGAPDWLDYGNVLNLVAPKADTAIQLIGGYGGNQKLAWRGGNKRQFSGMAVEGGENSLPFLRLYHENDKPTAAELGVYTTKEVDDMVAKIGGGGGLHPAGDSLYVDAATLGIKYNDPTAAVANADILRKELSARALYLFVADNMHLDSGAKTLWIAFGLEIKFKPGKVITYTTAEYKKAAYDKVTYDYNKALFEFKNTAEYPFYREYDASWNCPNKFNTPHVLSDGYAAIAGIVSLRSSYTGQSNYQLSGGVDNPEAPVNCKGPKWGINILYFDTLLLTDKRSTSFVNVNDMPYELVSIRNVTMRNCTSGLVWGTTLNTHKYGMQIMKACRMMIVEHVSWVNDLGVFALEGVLQPSIYIALVGHEGNNCSVNHIYMKNIIVRGPEHHEGKKVELYSVYPAGFHTSMAHHEVINMYMFDPNLQNVGIKIKKTWNMDMDYIIRRFEEDFFDVMLKDYNLDVEGTHGTWVNYYPEPNLPWDGHLNYGTSIAQHVSLRNCNIYLPKLQVLTAPEGCPVLSSFEITDCDFECDALDDGTPNSATAFNLVKVRWCDNTGTRANNQDVNRRVIFKRNRVYAPHSRLGQLVTISMQDDRPLRKGMYIVDISDNDVVCNNVRELSISASGNHLLENTPIDPKKCYIDRLIINNRITRTGSEGTHQMFTWGAPGNPGFKEMFLGGEWIEPDLNKVRVDQNVFSVNNTVGDINITCKNAKPGDTLSLIDMLRTNDTNLTPKSFMYTGTVTGDNGIFKFLLNFKITKVDSNAITFEYTDTDNSVKTIIWDGTNQASVTLGHRAKDEFGDAVSPISFKLSFQHKGVGATACSVDLIPNTPATGICKINLKTTQM